MTDLITADRLEPPKLGRPNKYTGQSLDQRVRLNLTTRQLAKVKKKGGQDWVRKLIDEAMP